MAVSRDGQYAAFTTGTESNRLWSFPFDAAAGRILGPGQPVTATTTAVLNPELAPDGRRIVYPLEGVGTGVGELWTEDLVSGEKRQLARDKFWRVNPKWAPDGARLAYRWEREIDKKWEATIAVRPNAGGDERLLADPVPAVHAPIPFGWSQDGTSVLVSTFLSIIKRYAVTLWSLAGAPHADKEARVLASNPDVDLYQESFSPNGRWVVFLAYKDDGVPDATGTLYVVPSAGGESAQWTRLTDLHASADKPRWSPDGQLVYFWLRQGSLWNVWGLRFDDARGTTVGAPFPLTHFDGRARHIFARNLQIAEQSVSRTRLLLPMTDTTGSIWMLDIVDK